MSYAELHCLSNFSFQRGASSALELFERAKRQGYSALAITDECTLSGIVRAWQAAKAVDMPLIIGSEVRIENGPKLVLLVEDLSGYQHLCRLITLARRRAEKGRYRLLQEDFDQPLPGLLALWVADDSDTQASIQWLRRTFADRLWLAVHLHCGQNDARHLEQRLALAASLNIRAALDLAERYHLRLTAQDMGSTGYRTIMFDLWNGNVWVRHQPMGILQQDAYQKNQCAAGR